MMAKPKGRPRTFSDQVKTVTLKLTPEAWENLDKLAENLGMTRSHLVEKIGLGKIPIQGEQVHLGESLRS